MVSFTSVYATIKSTLINVPSCQLSQLLHMHNPALAWFDGTVQWAPTKAHLNKYALPTVHTFWDPTNGKHFYSAIKQLGCAALESWKAISCTYILKTPSNSSSRRTSITDNFTLKRTNVNSSHLKVICTQQDFTTYLNGFCCDHLHIITKHFPDKFSISDTFMTLHYH